MQHNLQWLRRSRIHLQCRRPRFNPSVRKIPWRREWLPTAVFLPGQFHGQRSLASYSPWGHKESDTIEQLTHTHTQMKKITNKKLPYCTRNPIYSVLCDDLNGKEIQKREDICIYIADSLCCIAENNNILKHLYANNFFKKIHR